MSHVPQRKEKDCLNCGTIVQGRYCHVCGQENVVPKETFWHMVTHFFFDITHFDSQFFETVKDLLFRPGFLSKEYMAGRRANYLHPVKMYVFTSAIFFLLFFSFFKPTVSNIQLMNKKDRKNTMVQLKEILKKESDNAEIRKLVALLQDTTRSLTSEDILNINLNMPLTEKEKEGYIERLQNKIKTGEGDSSLGSLLGKAKDTSHLLLVKDTLGTKVLKRGLFSSSGNYKTAEVYDSAEHALPVSKRDGWFVRRLIKKGIYINEKYGENPDEALKKLGENILHRLPYMLFVSLPLFAFILRLVYIRRKQFYFADHGVFTIHLYIFTFLMLLLVFSIGKLNDLLHTGLIGIPIALLFIWLFIYLFKAMRNFYGQGRGKTFLKYLFVAFWSLIMMLILLILFMFFSAYTL